MNFSSMRMSIRLDRSYTQEALAAKQRFSTPHFITLLIERGYLKDDSGLPVLRTPITIDRSNLNLLSEIINGDKKYKLPVVFVSKTYYDENPVNVDVLAARLKGVAHVLTQQSNATNPSLRSLCNSQNEYRGAIGIYYPNPSIGHRRYLYRHPSGSDSFLLEKVVRVVINYCNAQMIDTLYTWQGVNNALLKDRLATQKEERIAAEAAKKHAEEETSRILDTLDEEERRIKNKQLMRQKLSPTGYWIVSRKIWLECKSELMS